MPPVSKVEKHTAVEVWNMESLRLRRDAGEEVTGERRQSSLCALIDYVETNGHPVEVLGCTVRSCSDSKYWAVKRR